MSKAWGHVPRQRRRQTLKKGNLDEYSNSDPGISTRRKLINLIETLTDMPFPLIIVVNDGSSLKHIRIFSAIETLPKCKVIHHEINKGKGAALKTGMREILHKHNNLLGCVTVDADGQHLPEDIYHVAAIFENNSQSLVLGCRDFKTPTVPTRNKMGYHHKNNLLPLYK